MTEQPEQRDIEPLVPPSPIPAAAGKAERPLSRVPLALLVCVIIHLLIAIVLALVVVPGLISSIYFLLPTAWSVVYSDSASLFPPIVLFASFIILLAINIAHFVSAVMLWQQHPKGQRLAYYTAIIGPIIGSFILLCNQANDIAIQGMWSCRDYSSVLYPSLWLYAGAAVICIIMLALASRNKAQ